MNIKENETQRKKEIYEYVTTTHMICFFIMIFGLVLSEDFFAREHFPVISTRFLLFFFISIIGFIGITTYNSRNKEGLKSKGYSWDDLLYFSFPLLVAVFILFCVKETIYYPQAILLVPVIIVASVGGKKPGLIMATLTIFMLFIYNGFNGGGNSVYVILESNLILMCVIYIVGWFIGIQADLEKQHRQELTKLANTDVLTGLYNHRYFQEKLSEYINKNSDTRPLSLIIIDIDFFKHYNDSYGHLSGDNVISSIGSILAQNVKSPGFASRYGGDEFVIVLPGYTSKEAAYEAQVISQELNRLNFPGEEYQPEGKITVSCGIATYPKQASNIKDLIEYADRALYRAKNLNRNKIEIYFSVFDSLEVEKNEEKLLNSIRTLVSVINARDRYTYGHSERVTDYSMEVARLIGIDEEEIRLLSYAAFLHDIGKIEIDRHILNKTDFLTKNEWNILKKHPEWGSAIVKEVKILEPAAKIILHHHENYDGSGYPDGLKREEIPLLSRIIRVVDSYDAMTSNRPYRKGMEIDKALQELERYQGTMFDPEITVCFTELIKREFKKNNNQKAAI